MLQQCDILGRNMLEIDKQWATVLWKHWKLMHMNLANTRSNRYEPDEIS